MKSILMEIGKILKDIPNMDKTSMAVIINPIDTMEQAQRLLKYLQENKDNKEIMKMGYLLKHNHEIIGN
ncbi:MAG: hypothetical protein IJE53_07070 [Bacilli bacterium]|nr:hypothetical protein [Bacilli bacterium]